MKSLFNKLVKRNGGFTLTELAVAMVVVGILASIAVPSFLGARNNAFDREAQAAVDAALNAASLHYANNGDFTDSASAGCDATASTVLAADLRRLEPNFVFLPGATDSDNPRRVSVEAAPTFNSANENLGCQAFYAAALSRSGVCWVGRLTVEGARLTAAVTYPIKILATNNTQNESNVAVDLTVNGLAYGAIRPTSPAAGATASAVILASVENACDASGQANPATTTGVAPGEFYDAWRTVKVAAVSAAS